MARATPPGRALVLALACALLAATPRATRLTLAPRPELRHFAASRRGAPWWPSLPGPWRKARQVARTVSFVGVLPRELVWHVLDFVPRPMQVASSLGVAPATLWQGRPKQTVLRGSADAPVTIDLKFFPMGDRVVAVYAGGGAVIWDAWLGRRMVSLEQPGGLRAIQVRVFPDGERLVVLGTDGAAVVWSASGHVLRRLPIAGVHHTVHVFPDGERIATGVSAGIDAANRSVTIYNVSDGALLHTLLHGSLPTALLELSPCGRTLASVAGGALAVWDAASGRLEHALDADATGLVSAVAVSEGGDLIVASTVLGEVRLWDGRTGSLRFRLVLKGAVEALALLGGGRRLLALTDASAPVFDTATGEELHELAGGGGETQRLAVSPDGEVVAACGGAPRWWSGMRVAIWSGSTGQRLYTSSSEEDAIDSAPHFDAAPAACSIAVGPAGTLSSWMAA